MLLDVGERDFAGRAVALFRDDDFDDALVLTRLVAVGAVQHQDGVGVLLYGTTFPEIRQPRPVVLPVLRGAIHLGQRDHRDLEFARQELEAAADLGDLLLARIAAVVRLDELKVVDDDELDVVLSLQPAGVRGDA